jgi:glutathione S-transferase
MSRIWDVFTSFAASGARLGLGTEVDGHAREPENLLELYEFEACPYCRKVREALTALDLDALVHPCPKGGKRFRPRVRELGGKEQFPFLVDPNTGKQMYESDEIVAYLFTTYGQGRPGILLRLPGLGDASSFLASALRPTRGWIGRASRAPEEPLELYSFEASPFSRLARETLCELEIPYVLHNVGKGTAVDWLLPGVRARLAPGSSQSTEHRRRFVERSARMMVPYLVDPNTGVEMFESANIQRYLVETYGASTER